MRDKYSEGLDLAQYSAVPLFNTRAVAQQTGVAASTLRAWERRYKILAPERARNDYRLYSERDIATIRWLKERIDAGISISQAIALFRHLKEEMNHQEKMLSSQSDLRREEELTGRVSEDTSQTTYDMRFAQERLLDAFNKLDEATASQLMAPMLAIYPLEQVCTELIIPTLWEVGRRWEQGSISVSIEHFASAFFQGLLTNLLHALPAGNAHPLIIACCAPGEEHAIAPLIFTLFLRRAGLRVAYLGQSIEAEGLLQTARQLCPALICISITLIAFLETLIDMVQKLQELPAPRPVVVFGGQVFEQRADLIARVPAIYLNGDMQSIIAQLKRLAYKQAG